MADWGGGYTAEFAIARVDMRTWTASSETTPIDSLTINANCTEAVPLLASATLGMTGEFENGWYQALMIADSREKVPLGVFEFARSSSEDNYGTDIVTAQGCSALRPADGSKMVTGEYAPVGADGAQYAAKVLRRALLCPVVVEGGFTLASNVVFGVGMSCLEAAWLILDAGGLCVQLDGEGAAHVRPKPTNPAVDLSHVNADLLVPGVVTDADLSMVKNRYYAIENGQVAVAENVDYGPASYNARGYWDDIVDTSPIRVNGETLQAYAERKLAEQSAVKKQVKYTREFYPGIAPFSVVGFGERNMSVVSQALACDFGVTVAETAEMEVTA